MVKKIISKILVLTAMTMFSIQAGAQNITGLSNGMEYFLYAAVAFTVFALVIAAYFLGLKNKYQREADLKTGRVRRSGLSNWWSDLDKKYFTKAASLEKEADVLLDHNYDGIKELDNALPPWWKWGFYFTVIVGVIYLFRFHVIKTGPTPIDEYEAELKSAAIKMESFKMNSKDAFDEKTVTLADAAGIAAGKKIFTGTCIACHGGNGEGNAVGPNLTDKYWIHGGSLSSIFKTITIGVPDKGMQAWGKTFSPTDIRNLSSYILSLQGSNPANAKAPQGDLFEEAKATDTSAVKSGSVQTKNSK